MTVIHTATPSLTIRAGKRALERLRQKSLDPADIHVIPGAAGGPKALGISGLDQAIFGDWLPGMEQERALIGASVGSWRFAAIASSDDPVDQLKKLAELYTCQRFDRKVTPEEVTRRSWRFLEELIGGREDHILEHPWYRLNVIVVRSMGLLAHDTRGRLGLGLMGRSAPTCSVAGTLGGSWNAVLCMTQGAICRCRIWQTLPAMRLH